MTIGIDAAESPPPTRRHPDGETTTAGVGTVVVVAVAAVVASLIEALGTEGAEAGVPGGSVCLSELSNKKNTASDPNIPFGGLCIGIW